MILLKRIADGVLVGERQIQGRNESNLIYIPFPGTTVLPIFYFEV